jgi:DNA-nicking Smr family endonuclease
MSTGKRRRGLSDDDRTVWKAVTQSIVPLRAPADIETDEALAEAPPPAKPARRTPATVVTSPPPLPAAPALAPLGRRMRGRVVRGKEAIDARLDLHGLTQHEAHDALHSFLRKASANGARLVLVITGKGRRDDGERGVLRRQVPQWLGLPAFRTFVIGFEDAHIAHGGEGALYVRVRRAR